MHSKQGSALHKLNDAPLLPSPLLCCCQALLHLPSTSAYDVWSAACCIYEAATGRLLFPVEQVAAVR
jgi:hypothetical protein